MDNRIFLLLSALCLHPLLVLGSQDQRTPSTHPPQTSIPVKDTGWLANENLAPPQTSFPDQGALDASFVDSSGTVDSESTKRETEQSRGQTLNSDTKVVNLDDRKETNQDHEIRASASGNSLNFIQRNENLQHVNVTADDNISEDTTFFQITDRSELFHSNSTTVVTMASENLGVTTESDSTGNGSNFVTESHDTHIIYTADPSHIGPPPEILISPNDIELAGELIQYCYGILFCIDTCQPRQEEETGFFFDGLAPAPPEVENDDTVMTSTSLYNISTPGSGTELKRSTTRADVALSGDVRRRRRAVSFSTDLLRQSVSIPSSASIYSGGYSRAVRRPSDILGRHSRFKRDVEKVCLDELAYFDICFCEERCIFYGDCCADMFHHCLYLNETDNILKYINETQEKFHISEIHNGMAKAVEKYPEDVGKIIDLFVGKFGSCEKVVDGLNTESFFLISRCPENTMDAALKEQCERPSSPLLPPVTAMFGSGDAPFRNSFCAKCHGINEDKLAMWTTKLDCASNITDDRPVLTMFDLQEFVKNGQCRANFEKPPGKCRPRSCQLKQALTEADRVRLVQNVELGVCSPTQALLCQVYYYPTEGYRNHHCQRCLDAKPKTPQGEYRGCVRERSQQRGEEGGLLLILDITGKYNDGTGREVISHLCAEREVFNPLTQECKQLYCAQGYEPYHGKCYPSSGVYFMEKSSQLFPDAWSNLILFTPTSENLITCKEFMKEMSNKVDYMPFRLSIESVVLKYEQPEGLDTIYRELSNFSGHGMFDCPEDVREFGNENVTVSMVTVTPKFGLDFATLDDLQLLAEFLFPGTGNEGPFEVLVTNMDENNTLLCPSFEVPSPFTEVIIDEYKDSLYAVFNSTLQSTFFPLQNIGLQIRFSRSGNHTVKITKTQTVFICEGSIFSKENCSVVAYWLNETVMNGSMLIVPDSERSYRDGEFEIQDNQVFVCSDFKFESERKTLKQNTTYVVVSGLFTCISILFLLAMVVFYCMFPTLCNLPGKLTASLAGTMSLTFFSNLFTLFDLQHDYICPVAAVLSHLVTLAHFGWMSAIAVNMALTFGPGAMNRLRSLSDDNLFIRYNIIVWGCSAVVVLTTILLDVTSDSDSSPASNEPVSSVLDHQSSQTVSDVTQSVSSELSFPRYGYPFCTWFSGPLWSRLAFVIIPYAITFLINVVSFTLTLVGIQNASKGADKLGKKSRDRVQCLIYIKLSTAMGFSWIFSLLINFVGEEDVLPYIYATLVLLQGVLLFLAFMANKRVYSLIIKRATGEERTMSTSVSATRGTREALVDKTD